jgi:hypothetical protein
LVLLRAVARSIIPHVLVHFDVSRLRNARIRLQREKIEKQLLQDGRNEKRRN